MAYTPALKRAIYKWRAKNREKHNAYSRKQQATESWKKYYKQWQLDNKDKIKEYNRRAYLKIKEKKVCKTKE